MPVRIPSVEEFRSYNIPKLDLAVLIATMAHSGQRDKQINPNNPYILHPLAVMQALETETQKIVGVLHDVIEDHAEWETVIITLFDDEVVKALRHLTHDKSDTYEEYITKVLQNTLATEVKLQDSKHNMSRLNGLPEEKRHGLWKRYNRVVLRCHLALFGGDDE